MPVMLLMTWPFASCSIQYSEALINGGAQVIMQNQEKVVQVGQIDTLQNAANWLSSLGVVWPH